MMKFLSAMVVASFAAAGKLNEKTNSPWYQYRTLEAWTTMYGWSSAAEVNWDDKVADKQLPKGVRPEKSADFRQHAEKRASELFHDQFLYELQMFLWPCYDGKATDGTPRSFADMELQNWLATELGSTSMRQAGYSSLKFTVRPETGARWALVEAWSLTNPGKATGMILFRGSMSVKDWLDDFQSAVPTQFDNGKAPTQYGSGFFKGVCDVATLPEFQAGLQRMMHTVKLSSGQVAIMGHSLGGAEASIFADLLTIKNPEWYNCPDGYRIGQMLQKLTLGLTVDRTRTITWGAPPMFNKQNDGHDAAVPGSCRAYISRRDLVPRIGSKLSVPNGFDHRNRWGMGSPVFESAPILELLSFGQIRLRQPTHCPVTEFRDAAEGDEYGGILRPAPATYDFLDMTPTQRDELVTIVMRKTDLDAMAEDIHAIVDAGWNNPAAVVEHLAHFAKTLILGSRAWDHALYQDAFISVLKETTGVGMFEQNRPQMHADYFCQPQFPPRS